MIRLPVVFLSQISIDDNGAAYDKRQEKSQHNDHNLHSHSDATERRGTDLANHDGFDGPHESLGGQVDDGGQRSFENALERRLLGQVAILT